MTNKTKTTTYDDPLGSGRKEVATILEFYRNIAEPLDLSAGSQTLGRKADFVRDQFATFMFRNLVKSYISGHNNGRKNL